MVVADDDTNGFLPEGYPENKAGIDIGGGDAAFADFLEMFEAIGLIEAKDAEDFARAVGKEGLDVEGGDFGVPKYRFFGGKTGLPAAAQFEGGDDSGSFCDAETFEFKVD